ncbi:MAG: helix-turn-helix domain-containing protein [Candidatus Eiseniibacteriota bacterium]
MRKIGENIRFYRNLRGLTQTALARKVQVAPAYISQIEANQRVPSLKVTRRIAAVLGIDMSILVREADPRAQEGRLSVSEKLDLLRTLIMAIEGESRAVPGGSAEALTAEGRGFVATELHSEPAYCIVLREFTSTATFGREAEDTAGECHFVIEGRVRVVGRPGAQDLEAGESRSLSGAGDERLSGSRGTRVLSIYAPRVPLSALSERTAESEAPSA